jgi:hypothetical protein
MPAKVFSCLLAIATGLLLSAEAAERKAYKHVDEKGNITYSQTPPVTGKEAKKIDISPAHRGTGGYSGRAGDRPYHPSYADQRNQSSYDYRKKQEEAQQKRDAELRAECARNRGTDCNNPQTLRDMEAQRIPGGKNYGAYRR